ncbi:DHA2 family efflux MFS transporter permease subunit [Streptomonospora wellingtoniae]|uniref:DHA2 family efflux MFS transporter permease subunit n=1 Tax=Streptomonospora wellingtoniae TaxID=3075544 RepID=A0ABU2L091_9ACTN|nr:DHA2 family efflux MFS transporter permease subunit [Streptomonospora sp. DSM 45055]MDT0304932.1 DHA2 family efflux MFS transporter permease subunit [Streptomonospora sp. DSM 45055]
MPRVEYKWLVAVTFVFGLIMQILDVTILNVALATLGRDFGVDEGTLQWVLTGYMTSLAVFIPASGWISDRFGSKRTFQSAVLVFTGASVLCGFAAGIEWLIAARVLQGVGGGMLVPVGQAMLFRAFPAEERAKASAVLMIPTSVAPALGPVLGGFLVEYASWRWIFFINVPIGALALLFTVLFLREEVQERPGGFDAAGFVLAGAGLASLLVTLDRAAQSGWDRPSVWGGLVAAAVLILLLVWRELRAAEPMLDLRLLRQRLFGAGNAALLCITAAMFGVLFLMPLYMQNLRGSSALEAGLVLMPQALGMVVTTQVVSRLYPRVGPRRLLLAGVALIGCLTLSFQLVGLATPYWVLGGMMFVQGIGMGASLVPLQAATFAQTPAASMGRATSLFNVSRQVATATGVAVLSTVLVIRGRAETAELGRSASDAARAQAQMDAYHGALLAAVVFAVLGVVVVSLIRDSDAAPSMRRGAAAPR